MLLSPCLPAHPWWRKEHASFRETMFASCRFKEKLNPAKEEQSCMFLLPNGQKITWSEGQFLKARYIPSYPLQMYLLYYTEMDIKPFCSKTNLRHAFPKQLQTLKRQSVEVYCPRTVCKFPREKLLCPEALQSTVRDLAPVTKRIQNPDPLPST